MYNIEKLPPKEVQDELKEYDSLVQTLLYSRGIKTKGEADIFLKKEWIESNPFEYKEMRKGAERLFCAIDNKENIGIFSDYDCDGIPSAAILTSTIASYNHENLFYYVPHRNQDGFGLNNIGIDYMVENNVKVLCVLDCGTAQIEHVKRLKELGIDVIILDHHLSVKLPEAYALINPTMEEGITLPHPCAAGITFLFIQAVIQIANEKGNKTLPVGWEKWQLDLVALATMSDMVPLHSFNRQFVYHGLNVARKSPRPGIQSLCKELKIQQENITQDDISFYIVPRINAASRMGEARIAYNLLTTNDPVRANKLAKQLTELNNTRKVLVSKTIRDARNMVEEKDSTKGVWVFGSRNWKPSIAGLVAQKLSEEYRKTIFVWGQSESEDLKIKGSYRSKNYDVFSFSQKIKNVFEEIGGHKYAGGFALLPGAESIMEKKLNDAYDGSQVIQEEFIVDMECEVEDLKSLFELTKKFAPFGEGNKPILVAIKNCSIERVIRFGKEEEHVKYNIRGDYETIEGITFFCLHKVEEMEKNDFSAIIGVVEYDLYRKELRVRVLKIV